MKRLITLIGLLSAAAVAGTLAPRPTIAAAARPGLRIYWVDVEGGAATLLVTPAGESVLVDSGWLRDDMRDAKRIKHAADLAGIKQIDHYVTTHWHVDHYGAISQVAQLMPVGKFYDRGIPESLPEDPNNFPKLIAAYRAASKGNTVTLRPGDTLPLKQTPRGPRLSMKVLAASANVVMGKNGPNFISCARHNAIAPDPSDNAKSITLLLNYGDFQFLNTGDLTWNVEHQLVCPKNRIGGVDLFQISHHGLANSNNPALLEAIQPRVVVINNGPRKGGQAEVFHRLQAVKSVEAVFQGHRNVQTGPADNTKPEFIANMNEQCTGELIIAEVAPDTRTYSIRVTERGNPHSFKTR